MVLGTVTHICVESSLPPQQIDPLLTSEPFPPCVVTGEVRGGGLQLRNCPGGPLFAECELHHPLLLYQLLENFLVAWWQSSVSQ